MNILKSRKNLASADVDAYDCWEEKFNAWQPYDLLFGTGLWPYPSHALGVGPSRSRSRGRLRRPQGIGLPRRT